MILLAIDPGGTCGMAWNQLHIDIPLDLKQLVATQMPTTECIDWCFKYITSDWVIFMERFFITSNTATLSPEGTHKTLDVIGTVKSICRWRGARFEFQTANDAKKFVNNDQLKGLGLWQPGEDHARDAVRHLVRGVVHHIGGVAGNDLMNRMA